MPRAWACLLLALHCQFESKQVLEARYVYLVINKSLRKKKKKKKTWCAFRHRSFYRGSPTLARG